MQDRTCLGIKRVLEQGDVCIRAQDGVPLCAITAAVNKLHTTHPVVTPLGETLQARALSTKCDVMCSQALHAWHCLGTCYTHVPKHPRSTRAQH